MCLLQFENCGCMLRIISFTKAEQMISLQNTKPVFQQIIVEYPSYLGTYSIVVTLSLINIFVILIP